MFDNSGASIPLANVLRLEIFRRAEAFIVAGEGALDRRVRWAHPAEIADIAKFLSGGELLLTAGYGLGSTPAEQRRFIASLDEVGAAGLAMELCGRRFTLFPVAAVEEAEKRAFPLIGLRHEVPFVEASAQVRDLLTEATLREVARSVEMNEVLTERLVSGADYVALVRSVSEYLGRPVALESADHDLQAFYGDNASTEPMLADWSTHSRSLTVHGETDESPECLRRPVVVQGSMWGYVHVPWEESLTHIDQSIVEQGASAIAISLLNERVSRTRSRHQQGILVNRLMLGDISGTGFVDRALRLGKDLRKARLAVAIVGADGVADPDLERQVVADLKASRFEALTADMGEAVLSVVALRSERALGQLADALTNEQRFIGISKIVSAADLPSAIQQARGAFLARQPCQYFDRLGILRLLVPLSNGADLAAFVEDELGALLQHDNSHASQLFETLVAFLRCDGNKTIAAKELFVQRRTLYYRLEKISQIIGLDLEDVEVRLRLQVAIRAAELLRNSRGARSMHG